MIKSGVMDMHIHTTNSDGEYTVRQIVERIKNTNIETFSITDHDNINSYYEINKLELEFLEFYHGVEISSIYQNYGMHILGYDFKPEEDLIELLKKIEESRKQRFLEMVEMLEQKYEIKIEESRIQEIITNHQLLGKPHMTNLLYQLGYGESSKNIYDKYLKGYKSKRKYRVNLEEVVKAIKKSNGIVVLAHPKEIEREYHIDIEEILGDLVKTGIDGIEVYNSIHSLEDIKRYLELAKRYHLLISGGSDYHGPFTKPNVELGYLSKEKIQVEELSLLKELRRRNEK